MFSAATFGFLDEVAANNNRGWFEANKSRYESLVRQPALEFWSLAGDSLTRLPRGYAVDHPALEDLKRKDFIALAPLSFDDIFSPGVLELTGSRFASASPLMKLLCEALGVPY